MKKTYIKFFIVILLTVLIFYHNTYADKKKFAFSYSAYTLPASALEIELWQTGRFDKGEGYYYRWQPRFEVEYGITDRLTSSIYMNFDQTKSFDNNLSPEPFNLSSTSVEFRYRLSNPDEYFVDPALYFEAGYGGDKLTMEPKFIFSKQFGDFSSTLNISSEFEKNFPENEFETELGISFGLTYNLNKNVSFGFEFLNERLFSNVFEKEENQASFLGPTISLQADKLYFLISFLTQIEGSPASVNHLDLTGHEKFQIRSVLGIEL